MILLVSSGAVRYLINPTPEHIAVLDTLSYDATLEGQCLLDLCKELNDDYGDALYDVLTSDKWEHVSDAWTPPEPIKRVYVTHLNCHAF